MIIDLTQIFAMQEKLDYFIEKNHMINSSEVKNKRKLALIVELCELANEVRCFKFWSNKAISEKQVLLDEYVDAIHFITSLGLNSKVNKIFNLSDKIKKIQDSSELSDAFIELIKQACNIDVDNKLSIEIWYKKYLEFGIQLGFTCEDIINAYNLKNKVNHERQKNNY